MSISTDIPNGLEPSDNTFEKHCVFCEQPPVDKNKEHVLPEWVIRMTGDPKRECTILTLSGDRNKRIMKFAFDQLQFPACTVCNDKFSKLEDQVKDILERMRRYQPISAQELSIFLDWIDKVRVGLWLGIRYLDRNSLRVDPNFHIAHRIGRADRVACLLLTDAPSSRLTFSGVSTVVFRHQPSSFALCINSLTVFNASTDFLIARRMGLPYPPRIEWHQGNSLLMQLKKGTERVMRPPLRMALPQMGTWLYQPMVRSDFIKADDGLWNTNYARHAFWNVKTGCGRVFVGKEDGSISPYPQEPSDWWVPSRRYASARKALNTAASFVLKMQMELWRSVSIDRLPKEQQSIRKSFEHFIRADLRIHAESIRRSES